MKANIIKKVIILILIAAFTIGTMPGYISVSAATKPAKPTITVKVTDDGEFAKVTINKTKNAEGYQVAAKLPGAEKYKKIATVELNGKKKRSITLKNLPYGTCSIKVRGYTVSGGKKVYGKYSKVKTITIEKSESIITTDLNEAKTGDIIEFGVYEQDNNFDNGKEPIEWVVLSNNGSQLFVVSKYAIEAGVMGNSYVEAENEDEYDILLWAASPLRKWLNDEFIKAAFNETETAMIADTELTDSQTIDKVFLLSKDEVSNPEYGFVDYKSRRCGATKYAKSSHDRDGDGYEEYVWTCDPYLDGKIHKTNDGKYACFWWLRTVFGDEEYGEYEFGIVSEVGYITTNDCYGDEMDTEHYDEDEDFGADGFGIRPAIVINITSA